MIFINGLESIVLTTRNCTMLVKYTPNGYLMSVLSYNIDKINFFYQYWYSIQNVYGDMCARE